jgi:hypothetical protein
VPIYILYMPSKIVNTHLCQTLWLSFPVHYYLKLFPHFICFLLLSSSNYSPKTFSSNLTDFFFSFIIFSIYCTLFILNKILIPVIMLFFDLYISSIKGLHFYILIVISCFKMMTLFILIERGTQALTQWGCFSPHRFIA